MKNGDARWLFLARQLKVAFHLDKIEAAQKSRKSWLQDFTLMRGKKMGLFIWKVRDKKNEDFFGKLRSCHELWRIQFSLCYSSRYATTSRSKEQSSCNLSEKTVSPPLHSDSM